MRDDWDNKAEFMRAAGATSATWSVVAGVDRLTSLTLSPRAATSATQHTSQKVERSASHVSGLEPDVDDADTRQ